MSSYSNWSSEDDEILIDFVRNHEAIYNVKLQEYRKTQLKQNWWREIGQILNKTDSDCSKRWIYIRDYYVRRRGKPGITSGEAAKKRSHLLSFLDSLPSSQRNTFTDVVDENSGDSSVKLEPTENPGENMENTNSSEETQSNTEIEHFRFYNNNEDAKAASDKKRRNDARAQEPLNLLKKIANQDSTRKEDDENDLFFGSMTKIVKKLPPYEQAQLRMQIGLLVGNAQLRHISNNSPQSISISPRPSTSNSDYCENPVP